MIRIVATLIAAYSLYVLWQSTAATLWGGVPISLLGLVVAGGVAFERWWAPPLAYGFLWMIATSWMALIAAGWSTRRPAPLELVPGLALVLACAGCALVIYRHSRRRH